MTGEKFDGVGDGACAFLWNLDEILFAGNSVQNESDPVSPLIITSGELRSLSSGQRHDWENVRSGDLQGLWDYVQALDCCVTLANHWFSLWPLVICKKVWPKSFFLFKQNNNHKFPPANSKLHIKFQINMNGETGSDSFCIELSTKNTSLRIQWLVLIFFSA